MTYNKKSIEEKIKVLEYVVNEIAKSSKKILILGRNNFDIDSYLRDKDNIETSIFGQNASNMSGVNGVNDTNSSLESGTNNSMINHNNDSYTETNMGYEESGESRERR